MKEQEKSPFGQQSQLATRDATMSSVGVDSNGFVAAVIDKLRVGNDCTSVINTAWLIGIALQIAWAVCGATADVSCASTSATTTWTGCAPTRRTAGLAVAKER